MSFDDFYERARKRRESFETFEAGCNNSVEISLRYYKESAAHKASSFRAGEMSPAEFISGMADLVKYYRSSLVETKARLAKGRAKYEAEQAADCVEVALAFMAELLQERKEEL